MLTLPFGHFQSRFNHACRGMFPFHGDIRFVHRWLIGSSHGGYGSLYLLVTGTGVLLRVRARLIVAYSGVLLE